MKMVRDRMGVPGLGFGAADIAFELFEGRFEDAPGRLGVGPLRVERGLPLFWNEDWGGWARKRQVNGYYVDVMRSACRTPGLNFGIYNVLGRPSWEIQARGFLEVGHGVKAISFFNYGPYYSITSDANSHRPEVYEAIKQITFPTGAVETHVMAGKTAPGDVAQLLSVTGDIWYATRDNVFGKERAWLNLLLRHCNARCDVLSEDDLASLLPAYRMLFVTDANLRRSAVPSLVKWVHDGGVLYLSAGALARDASLSGTYHYAGAPDVSWADFARAIFADAQVFPGPVTDDFHLENKLNDSVHFNAAGLADHAEQWRCPLEAHAKESPGPRRGAAVRVLPAGPPPAPAGRAAPALLHRSQ